MKKTMKKSKTFKMTGNLPTISFAIFIALAFAGIMMFGPQPAPTGNTFIDIIGSECASAPHHICAPSSCEAGTVLDPDLSCGAADPSFVCCKDTTDGSCTTVDDCAGIICTTGWGISSLKCNNITNTCYCGGYCGDNVCDSYEMMLTGANKCADCQECEDSDPSNNISVKGVCVEPSGINYDFCFNSTAVIDFSCAGLNNCGFNDPVSCGEGNVCIDGACISAISIANSSVTLLSPANSTNFTAPSAIKFKWIPVNFTELNVSCMPVAQLNETQIYPEEAGEFALIDCENNKNCSWTSDELNDSYAGSWQWLVGCSVNAADFDDPDWINVIMSEIRDFEIEINASYVGCTPDWAESAWSPEACSAEEIQTKTYVDQNSCRIAPTEIECTTWILGTSTCVLKKSCDGKDITPSGMEQKTNWAPYPCIHEQWAIFQMPNTTMLNQTRNCCVEKWTSKWSECADGKKTKIWEDENGCDTTYKKPKESNPQSCSFLKSKAFYIIAGIFAIVLILTITLFAKRSKGKRKTVSKAEQKEENEEEEESEEGKRNPEIDNYIKKAFIKGMSKIQIRKQLLDAGWPKKTVDDALRA